jgi:N-acyl-phosphatidylethanolamine-hydrolysing phospholipase D
MIVRAVFKSVTKSIVKVLGIAGACVVLASGCSTLNPYFDSSKPHHTANGFKNNYGKAGGKPLSELIGWKYEAYKKGDPKAPSQFIKGYDGFTVLKPDVAALNDNCPSTPTVDSFRCKGVSITWIGHATVLVQMGGINIITDPQFSERASFTQLAGPKRKVAPPLSLAQLPHIHLVLTSHNHYDHLDESTVKGLEKQVGGPPLFAAPLGIDLWLKKLGMTNVERFDWWDKKTFKGVEIHFVPVQHWSARTPFDNNATLWGGWVVKETPIAGDSGKSMFFAGDTGFSKDFADIGSRLGPIDYSLIPVGAYEPRWFMMDQHVNPEEAVQIHKDMQSKWSLGIHWGTFELTDEALDQPIGDLIAARTKAGIASDQFVMFRHGQTQFFKR